MSQVITHPPRTIMEVYKMLPEGTMAELIDGFLYMSPSPTARHQEIVSNILEHLLPFVRHNQLGKIYTAPIDVYLDETANAVQPDIVFISRDNLSIIKDRIHGVPDIAIEVLSETNRDHDLKKKKELYERFGVREYFVVNPDTREVLAYTHQDGRYRTMQQETGKLSSVMLKLTVDF